MTTGKSVVLMSGGIDSSATALAILTEGYETSGLFVDYGQPDSLWRCNPCEQFTQEGAISQSP